MNILNLLFKKKTKVENVLSFLESKFTPIAKYIYHGRLIISECPIAKDNQLYYVIYFVGKNSKQLGKYYISIGNIFEWMGIIKNKGGK